MDGKRRNILDKILDVDSEQSWMGSGNDHMPEKMRQEIIFTVRKEVYKNKRSDKIMLGLARTVAAACLLAFIIFAHEQYYTLNKIGQLEARVAKYDGTLPERTQDQLLIINSFFSWSDVKNLPSASPETIYTELFPTWFHKNWFGDGKIKTNIEQYIHEYHLVTKIHLP